MLSRFVGRQKICPPVSDQMASWVPLLDLGTSKSAEQSADLDLTNTNIGAWTGIPGKVTALALRVISETHQIHLHGNGKQEVRSEHRPGKRPQTRLSLRLLCFAFVGLGCPAQHAEVVG